MGFFGLPWKEVGWIVLEGLGATGKNILAAATIIFAGLAVMAAPPTVVVIKKA